MPKYQRWKGIMKCYPFEEKRLTKWESPYLVQIKYDGFRSRSVPIQTGLTLNEYLLLSSEENIFYSVPHLNRAFSSLRLGGDFDGELYNHDIYLEGGFDLLSSIISRTVNLHPRHEEIEFHCFDIINDQTQIKRLLTIENLKGIHPKIKVAPFWICENLEDVKRAYDEVIEAGYEGIVVRHMHNFYEEKRSTYVMKFKPKKKDEYQIVGWNEETTMGGTPKGRIGSLIMSSQNGDTFAVGAGLDSDEKDFLWEKRNELSGKNAVVHYQHLTNKKIPKGCFDIEIPDLGV